MERFTQSISSESVIKDETSLLQGLLGEMNKEEHDEVYNAIKLQIIELNDLLEQRNNGINGLDEEIDELNYNLRSAIKIFSARNPNHILVPHLKKMVGLN